MRTLEDILKSLPEDRRRRATEEFERLQREEASRRIWDMQANKCRDFANIASRFTR
jgi:hypothetical protein